MTNKGSGRKAKLQGEKTVKEKRGLKGYIEVVCKAEIGHRYTTQSV